MNKREEISLVDNLYKYLSTAGQLTNRFHMFSHFVFAFDISLFFFFKRVYMRGISFSK